MNQAARKHLDRAKDLIERGESYYRKAAEEIIAAQKADPTLSNREIGEWFGRGKDWVRNLVLWHTNGEPDRPIDWRRGSHGTANEIRAGAKKLLREAPPEQVEQIIAELPPERQSVIASKVMTTADPAALTEAMHDPMARMRAEGAASRSRQITRESARSERRASGRVSPLESGHGQLLLFGRALGDLREIAHKLDDIWTEALRVCSDEQLDAMRGRAAIDGFEITKVLAEIQGEGIDKALNEILKGGESE
jgi:hypothetical protein